MIVPCLSLSSSAVSLRHGGSRRCTRELLFTGCLGSITLVQEVSCVPSLSWYKSNILQQLGSHLHAVWRGTTGHLAGSMAGAAGCLDPPPPTPRQALRPSVLWNASNVLSFSCVYGWTVQHLSDSQEVIWTLLSCLCQCATPRSPLRRSHPCQNCSPCYHFLGLKPRLKLGVQALWLNSESSQKERKGKHFRSWFALLGLFFAVFDEEKRNKCSTNWVQESCKTVVQIPVSVASLAALVT